MSKKSVRFYIVSILYNLDKTSQTVSTFTLPIFAILTLKCFNDNYNILYAQEVLSKDLLIQELVSWIWWLSVVSTLFYVVFFAVGPGSIPWMITAELFSQGPRPAAMSVAVLINWCANFIVAIGFPTMQVISSK